MDYLIVFLLVVLSGLFSGLTLGFFSLNLTSLERKIKLKDWRAVKIYPVRKNGNLLLCTLLLGNVAVNSSMAIFLGNIATGLVAGLVATGLIVVFGEIIPQAVFARYALDLGSRSVWIVRIFIFLFYPVAYPLSYMLDKILGEELATIWNKKEIKEIIKHHEDSPHSEIDEDEERILLGALAFSDMTASMVMTPRTVIFALEEGQRLDEELLIQIKEKGFSRIPVYFYKQDNITGLLYIKDLLGAPANKELSIKELMKPDILAVKTTIKLDNLLNHFLFSKKHLAGVYDEFGALQGIVTLEDIIEEILKIEIVDEADKAPNMQHLAISLNKRNLLEE